MPSHNLTSPQSRFPLSKLNLFANCIGFAIRRNDVLVSDLHGEPLDGISQIGIAFFKDFNVYFLDVFGFIQKDLKTQDSISKLGQNAFWSEHPTSLSKLNLPHL